MYISFLSVSEQQIEQHYNIDPPYFRSFNETIYIYIYININTLPTQKYPNDLQYFNVFSKMNESISGSITLLFSFLLHKYNC